MVKEQVVYERGVLRILNPDAPSVSSITLRMNKAESKQMLRSIKRTVSTDDCRIKSVQKLDFKCNETALDTIESRGFVCVGKYSERDIYVGKLVEDGVDVVIIHEMRDGKSNRQVQLSPRIHTRISNLEYLKEIVESI